VLRSRVLSPAVWQKKAANWLIVHEPFSAPLPMEAPKQ
jgi:hypothetical protein